MELAMIGLGKMGANMARRLLKGGHRVIGMNRSFEVTQDLARETELTPTKTLEEVVETVSSPRVIWVMVPSGAPTEAVINKLSDLLAPGDTIIDGGNTFYKDDIRRSALLQEKGIHYVDVGTSGGVWGLQEGYSMMIGGDEAVVSRLSPIFETLAPSADQGWGRVGPVGAGHFVKMVHNGIEYGLMEAYAEGFELMEHKQDMNLDLHQIAEIWRYGSVVRSWLLDLTAAALQENPTLEGIAAYVTDSGEGRWTVAEAIDLNCSIPVITMALQRRFRSREAAPFGDKLLSAMRHQFGGHAIQQEEK
ncbi:MAG: decarboxylating 6-phosphogluconate dehydrogenase [Brevefilum sp.]|nr:decarboxylating 6-phosphogluconate dehydrogenase [Brevefilum sp.]